MVVSFTVFSFFAFSKLSFFFLSSSNRFSSSRFASSISSFSFCLSFSSASNSRSRNRFRRSKSLSSLSQTFNCRSSSSRLRRDARVRSKLLFSSRCRRILLFLSFKINLSSSNHSRSLLPNSLCSFLRFSSSLRFSSRWRLVRGFAGILLSPWFGYCPPLARPTSPSSCCIAPAVLGPVVSVFVPPALVLLFVEIWFVSIDAVRSFSCEDFVVVVVVVVALFAPL